MRMKDWSDRFDARLVDWMKEKPAPPLWLLVALHVVALVMIVALINTNLAD